MKSTKSVLSLMLALCLPFFLHMTDLMEKSSFSVELL